MIVTIDGPAGAGKSTVARRLAERLGFRFLDTGAMYRAVALAALRQNVAWEDEEAVGRLAAQFDITLEEGRVYLDGEDVSEAIRTPEVTAATKHAADNPRVREQLVQKQREIAWGGNFVTEGRDQGTVAFPNSRCKIYLVASPEERARRRAEELREKGLRIDAAEVMRQQNQRDEEDSRRKVGGMRRAEDAVEFNTDGLSIDQVVDGLVRIVNARLE